MKVALQEYTMVSQANSFIHISILYVGMCIFFRIRFRANTLLAGLLKLLCWRHFFRDNTLSVRKDGKDCFTALNLADSYEFIFKYVSFICTLSQPS